MTEQQRDTLLEQITTLLKEHGFTLKELTEAYQGTTTIPATTYNKTLTPLEATAHYLHTQQLPEKDIAKLLHRPNSTIRNALNNVTKKGVPPTPAKTPYHIPVTAFSETLSPAEAVVLSLQQNYDLPNNEIAKILDRDPRNTWKLLQQAKKKLGGEEQ